MKLTCVVIVAVLFLTACQLATADISGGMRKHRALRSTTKLSRSPFDCSSPGAFCGLVPCCDSCNVLGRCGSGLHV
uniref:Conotoxin Leo-O3 n=1 Tax=Conus leopardus TaxID=101306 RepID=O163_CONLE|nr:RecName: Full=Conotoxin Leo-O3; Flags: Precursor [Conus leopardus]